MANKVQFGLKNVHYAVPTQSGYGTPVAIPGAVSLTLTPEGEKTKFYADNVEYYVSEYNKGYTGTLEVALLPDAMLKDVFQFTEGATSKVLTEHSNTEAKHFALLFQIEGDESERCYVFYDCVGARPSIDAETLGETKDPKTASIELTVVPTSTGIVSAKTTADTPTATKTGWFTSVFTE